MLNITNKFIYFLIWSMLIATSSSIAAGKQCVILLHGLGRTHYSMSSLASTLKKNNYIVVNQRYPSTSYTIEELGDKYIPIMLDECARYHPSSIHFITHSMGGIILLTYLKSHNIPELSSIVMLAPPNHGSQLADLLQGNIFYKLIMGPAAQELTTFNLSQSDKLYSGNKYQIGVIAGNYTLTPFSYFIFHEPNDGKVAVSSTKINNMTDFIVLPVSHTFMMNNTLVQNKILHFLRYGSFN